MELREFICNALTDIVNGVKDAQEKSNNNGASIAYNGTGSDIEFNINLTEFESKGKDGGIGVAFGVIGASGDTNKSNTQTSATSIKFKVPIFYPKIENP